MFDLYETEVIDDLCMRNPKMKYNEVVQVYINSVNASELSDGLIEYANTNGLEIEE